MGAACKAAVAAWDWLVPVLSHFLDEHVSAGGCLAWCHTSESLPGTSPCYRVHFRQRKFTLISQQGGRQVYFEASAYRAVKSPRQKALGGPGQTLAQCELRAPWWGPTCGPKPVHPKGRTALKDKPDWRGPPRQLPAVPVLTSAWRVLPPGPASRGLAGGPGPLTGCPEGERGREGGGRARGASVPMLRLWLVVNFYRNQ